MYKKNTTWNEKDKKWITKRNNWKIRDMRKLLDKIDNDHKSDQRIASNICKYCYYKESISLQAFTDTECGNCKVKITHVNSDINVLCDKCATKFDCCKHCGGEMD